MGTRDEDDDKDKAGDTAPESLADVLASIRALVSAETSARLDDGADSDEVLMLTPEMRVERPSLSTEILAEGLGPAQTRPVTGAPILDEEALRAVINSIVREELQGELGERISRNLHKLVRREISQMLDDVARQD